MNLPLFFFLLFALGAGCVWIGQKASKGTTTHEEYFLGGRSLGLFPLAMTLLATQLGGGALMGAAEEAYTKGWFVFFYPLGMVLGLLVLGLGFGARMRTLNLTTVAELFEKVYGSVRLRQVASLLSIASLFFILIAQGIAARKFFCSLGFDGGVLYSVFWLVLVFYTVMGGLKAVVKTDVLQASFILGAFFLTFVWTATQQAPPIQPTVMTAFSFSDVPWLSWLLLPLFFMLIEQDMGQRCFAAKKPRTVSLASCFAALLLLLGCLCPIYFGSEAGRQGLPIPQGASVLMTAVQAFTNPTISTFLICAILMAIISTADSLLCSISSNLSCDFSFLSAQPIKVSRLITASVGIITLTLSFLFDNVVSLLMFSYELAVSVLLIPVLMGVFLKQPQKRSALFSMACGSLGFLLLRGVEYKEMVTLSLAAAGFFVSEGAPVFAKRAKKLFQNK